MAISWWDSFEILKAPTVYSQLLIAAVIFSFFIYIQFVNSSGSLNASVELEDTAYYRLKSVKGVSFNYSLGMQWIGCFYWNKRGKHWASDGCQLEKSINHTLVCRCNHLTAFSGGFIQPPNSLHLEDLRDPDK